MDNALTYQDFMQRLNIQDLLLDVGYVHNRKDGLRYPSFVRLDREGRRIRGDKFLVTPDGQHCFQPPQQRTYNVISFIKEHPQLFADYRPGMNLDHLVNVVGHRLLNHPLPDREQKIISPKKDYPPFDLSRYNIHSFDADDKASQSRFFPYFKYRGIRRPTQMAFREFFYLTTENVDDGNDKFAYTNIAFPLTKPGEDTIIGFEVRGKRRDDGRCFKGKAQGSNGREGLWIANLSHTPLDAITDVTWFESAYDAMSEYQLLVSHFGQADAASLPQLRVSTGGHPTTAQISALLRATPNATHFLSFDNDEAGEQFVSLFRQVAKDMGFPADRILVATPRGFFKDWNDALLGKEDPLLLAKGGQRYDYAATTPGYAYHARDAATDAVRPSFKEITFDGITYACRELPDKDGEPLLIGSLTLRDALQPHPSGSAHDGFVSPLAESIYDNIFYFTDQDNLDTLDDKALLAVLADANPDFFVSTPQAPVDITPTFAMDPSLPTEDEGVNPRFSSAYFSMLDAASHLHRQLLADLAVADLNDGPLRHDFLNEPDDDYVGYSALIDLDADHRLRATLYYSKGDSSLDFHHAKLTISSADGRGGTMIGLTAPLTYQNLLATIREKTASFIPPKGSLAIPATDDATFVKSLLGKPLANHSGSSLLLQSMKNSFVVYRLNDEPGVASVSSLAALIRDDAYHPRPISSVHLPSSYPMAAAPSLREQVDAVEYTVVQDFKNLTLVLAKDLGLSASAMRWTPYFKDPAHPSVEGYVDIGADQRVGTLRLVALYEPDAAHDQLLLTTVAAQIIEAYKPDKLVEQAAPLDYPKFITAVRARFDALDPTILSSGRYQFTDEALPFRVALSTALPDYEPERRVDAAEGIILNHTLRLAERLLDDVGVRADLPNTFGAAHPRIDDELMTDASDGHYGIRTRFSIPLGQAVLLDLTATYLDKTPQHDALELDSLSAQLRQGAAHYDVPLAGTSYEALLDALRTAAQVPFPAVASRLAALGDHAATSPATPDASLARYQQQFRLFHQRLVQALGVDYLNKEASSLDMLPKVVPAVPDTAAFANYDYRITLPNDTHIEGGFTLQKAADGQYQFYHSHAYVINSTGLDSHIEYDDELPYDELQEKITALVADSHFLDVSVEEPIVSYGPHR